MSLTRPHIVVKVRAGRPFQLVEPDGDARAHAQAQRARNPGRGLSFSEIRVSEGIISVTEPSRGIAEELSNVELSFAWPSIARSFGATGRFVWRGEAFDASANAADLLAALSGDRSGLKLRLAGAPFKLAFDGHISQRPTLKMEGTLATDGKSLREMMRWASMQPLPGGGGGRFALKAQTMLTGGNFALSNANLELDGNVTEGVLALATEPRMTVKGTLAADALDLTPYVSNAEVLRANERDWSRGALAVDGLADFDLDLRLSAARVTVGTAKLGRTGVAANLRSGRLTVAIGEAQAFGGSLKGALVLAKEGEDANIKSQLQFTDVDLEACLGELFGLRRLEGKGNLTFSLSKPPATACSRSPARSAAPRASRARQGAITGFNVEQLLKRLEQRPLSIAGDFRRGRTPFERLDVALRIAGRHRAGRGREARRRRHPPRGRRLGLDPDARPRPEGHRLAGLGDGRERALVRAALRGAGPLGRPDHAARRAEPDPPLRRRRAAARRGARPQDPRRGAHDDRQAQPRRAGAGGRRPEPAAPAAAKP